MSKLDYTRREFIRVMGLGAATLAVPGCMGAGSIGVALPHILSAAATVKRKPNIIHIMLDELGYFELSCMGNKYLKTPDIDRMAAEGMRFTQCLAGGPVCAPTRSVLITGQHTGHTTVRANGSGLALRTEDVTIAQVLKKAGYATGGFGKWGLGDCGTTGVPEKHGFDIFYGYYHQVHAHSFYPRYLLRNSKKEYLEGNTGDYHEGNTFSHHLIYEESVKFIRENRDRPFFCYLPWTPPHGLWGFPEDEPAWKLFKDKQWNAGHQKRETDARVYAAMVSMVDRQIGEIFKLLKELGIDEDTIVFFSGDNGGQAYFKNEEHPRGIFDPNGGVFRGGKRELYEGGLRIPFIVHWPGKIKAGTISEHLCYFPDIMPTLAELAGVQAPESTDGISMLPTLIGEKQAGRRQRQHDYLYWEYQDQTAVRIQHWKAIQEKKGEAWALYDLRSDSHEDHNLADRHPDILNKMMACARQAHTPNVSGKILDPAKGFMGHAAD